MNIPGSDEKTKALPDTPQGQASSPARRIPEPHLSPTHAKGALSTRRSSTQRFPETKWEGLKEKKRNTPAKNYGPLITLGLQNHFHSRQPR